MKPSLAAAARWAGLLAVGAALLAGRFEWAEAGGSYAREAYLSCLYFFLLAVPFSFFVTLRLSRSRALARGVAALLFVVGCLPYHWLGLSRLRYQLVITPYYAAGEPPRLAWLPQALGQPGSPNERWLMATLLVALTASAYLLLRGRPQPIRLRCTACVAAIYCVIAVETLVHTSMRSPYTYIIHFERPDKWYHSYLLPDGKAAVNADVDLFTSLDGHFNGIPKPVFTLVLRRSFLHYLGSAFTYFFNPFYVYLALNSLIWPAAAACMFGYVRRVHGSPQVAWLVAGLVLCGNGFIIYVAQPMSYLASYAIIAFVLYLYEAVMVPAPGRPAVSWRDATLFGVALGLCAATYDMFAWYPTLLVYAWLRRARMLISAASIAIAAAIPAGFLAVQYGVLKVPQRATNFHFASEAALNLRQLLEHPGRGLDFERIARFLILYGQDLIYGFAVAGMVLGVLGVVLAAERQVNQLFVVLLLPSLLTAAFFYFGGVTWGRVTFAAMPRLSYVAYPAVYLAAAVGIHHARLGLERTLLKPWAYLVPWLALGLIFVYHNLDVFGFPAAAYHFYWPTPVGCDPYAEPASCVEVP